MIKKTKVEKIKSLLNLVLEEAEARILEYSPTDLNKLLGMLLVLDETEDKTVVEESPKSKASVFLEKNLQEKTTYKMSK